MTAPDNERPSTEDVRVGSWAVRAAAEALKRGGQPALWDEHHRRAVALVALEASGCPQRVAELEAERDRLVRAYDALMRHDRSAELEAENTRLREALAAVRRERHHWCESMTGGTDHNPRPRCTCPKAARDALIDAALAHPSDTDNQREDA